MKSQSKYVYFLLILLFSATNSFAQKGKSKPKSSKYDFQGAYFEGIARVKMEHKWGFIDTTGNVIIPPKYNEVTNFSGGLAKVRMGQKWGLVDTKGTVIIKPTFDAILDFVDGKAKVLLNGEEYYMNREGQRVGK
ncbi:MAG: WG repeat-containing protein [Bacteroidetes bacterium]|nr:WG repeat-containing protein [Bacteroidota bacterium]